jgi:hypothetical protein
MYRRDDSSKNAPRQPPLLEEDQLDEEVESMEETLTFNTVIDSEIDQGIHGIQG